MRIALIADIHGNLPALQAVLDEIDREQPDRIVCLGDVGAMGPFPCETLERIHDLGCPVIMGNGDADMLEPPVELSDDETTRRFQEMDRWCAEQLSSAHLDFVRSFLSTHDVRLDDDRSMLCFHGSPRSHDEIISATTPEGELSEMLGDHRATIMAGGHWHFQMLRRFRDMILFNPGSVGLPYEFDADGEVFIPSRAEYGVITVADGNLRLQHRRVDFDSDAKVRAMRDRGFPHAEWYAVHHSR